ncbi:MAG: site-specific DNA-methyltransferase [Microbacterium sp.]|uniref:site-specific DNA-methyltransferase n=1 Tax=Microbacterium sp. TaxID=51671 RepID=UPI00271F028B|nr:site-specific DNA-methyltransferase [Microbacterium sp.]MDO8382336.1 site-specific DNA-methyltransferase [Microbacterium sp.]
MAHVDNLIERIPDPHLRAQIAEEVAKLVEHKDFGLVFQRHLPEDLEVPGTRPRRGDMVRLRADPEKQNHVVLATKDGRATIIAVDAAKQTIEGSESAILDHDQLVVVKDFSVPIYPGLVPLGEINRGGDKPAHVVIEGENYYALETLLYTHERKVDLIYIDPPYNTGADDWIYNDRFVAANDSYRHSKWLSFMERRLIHARRLLKPTGVIIVAIGDDEHHRLRMLLDQIFGPQNFIANVTWQGGGSALARHHAGGVDYMLMYGANADSVGKFLDPKPLAAEMIRIVRDELAAGASSAEAQERLRAYIKSNARQMSEGLTRFNNVDDNGMIYETADLTNRLYRPNLKYPVIDPESKTVYDPPDNGWTVRQEVMREWVDAGLIAFGKRPRKKKSLSEYIYEMPVPTFSHSRNTANTHLERVLGAKLFPFPKDHEVLMRWLRMTGPRDAVVLDFFAGSGSTAEAVMRLNAEDGGTRQCIIVTNNEVGARNAADLRRTGAVPGDQAWEAEGVFHKVTRPRIETIVTGIRLDGSKYSNGLDENVAFFKLTYEDQNLIALGRRFDAVAPLLWMKAGGVGPVVRRRGDALWALPSGAIYGVLFAPAQAKAFAELIAVHDCDLRHLFVVTDSESEFQEAVAYLPLELRLETTRLYADYLHSFEINGKG